MPTPNLQDIISAERTEIVNKAILRTALMAEKFFPASAEDARPDAVKAYEAEQFDNKESPLYGNGEAAQLWAVIQGFGTQTFKHETDGHKAVTIGRGAVVVPVDRRYFKWADTSKDVVVGAPYICTAQETGRFRAADGRVVHLKGASTYNVRPATAEEIVAVIDGLLAVEPATFIKNLGNALDGIDC